MKKRARKWIVGNMTKKLIEDIARVSVNVEKAEHDEKDVSFGKSGSSASGVELDACKPTSTSQAAAKVLS